MVFICRLCGKCENESSGLAIFGEQGAKEALAYKIKLSLDISVYEYDPLPKYICKSCLGKLFTTFTFQECCRRAQILLRERFLSSKSWSPNVTTSTTTNELEQLPNESIDETIDDTPIPENTRHTPEDAPYSCSSETTYCLNETNAIDIKEEHAELTNDVLTPATSNHDPQTQLHCGPEKPPVANKQTEKNARPELEPSRAEIEMTIFGEPFEFNTFLRNGILEEFVETVGNKGSRKPNSRKTKKMKPSNRASVRSCTNKQKTNIASSSNNKEIFPVQKNNLASTASVSNRVVVEQNVNAIDVHVSSSSGVRSHEGSKVVESNTNAIVGNLNGDVPMTAQEGAVRSDYISPDLYVTPQTISLVDVQHHAGSSLSQEIPSLCNNTNTLKIVDVFSVQEISDTSTPNKFATETSHTSDLSNWHTPENQLTSPPTSKYNMHTSSMNPSNVRNWHSPSPQNLSDPLSLHTAVTATNSQNASKKKKKCVNSESNTFLPGEEDEILVIEIVKANKDSIAQHWEKCPSGFKCKFCSKTHKKLNKCENHIRFHLGVKPYECPVCKRRYHKKRLLNEHCTYHTGKKLYQCKECDKSFRYRKNFKSHAESHVQVLHSNFLCEICGKTFQLQFDYWSHKTSKHVIVDTQTIEVD